MKRWRTINTLPLLLLWAIAARADAGMATIPAGSYIPFFNAQGQPVQVPSFQMDIYPVTERQFADFVRANPEWRRSRIQPLFTDPHYLSHWRTDLQPEGGATSKSPVVEVSWFVAKAYCESLGKQLPTVDQWEYAASETNFLAASETRHRILEWYSHPTDKTIPAIGTTPANRYGVYDLHGLIWEWTLDFDSDFSNADASSFCGNGSQGAADPSDYAKFMRYSFRQSLEASYTTANLGFRCVREGP